MNTQELIDNINKDLNWSTEVKENVKIYIAKLEMKHIELTRKVAAWETIVNQIPQMQQQVFNSLEGKNTEVVEELETTNSSIVR